ncbi:MAG TPA: hypothetical protein VEI04_01015 [Syntrophobacteria bacterium]|nr:hypothetical protein [Syntrophobacteria bacterium]
MTIEVPHDFLPVLELLKLKGYDFDGSRILKKLLDAGLEQVQSDTFRGAGDQRDRYSSLFNAVETLRKGIFFLIDDNDYTSKTHTVSATWGRPWEFTKTLLLVLGMTRDGYRFLRYGCKDYAEDANFRMIVDKLSKDLALGSPGDSAP